MLFCRPIVDSVIPFDSRAMLLESTGYIPVRCYLIPRYSVGGYVVVRSLRLRFGIFDLILITDTRWLPVCLPVTYIFPRRCPHTGLVRLLLRLPHTVTVLPRYVVVEFLRLFTHYHTTHHTTPRPITTTLPHALHCCCDIRYVGPTHVYRCSRSLLHVPFPRYIPRWRTRCCYIGTLRSIHWWHCWWGDWPCCWWHCYPDCYCYSGIDDVQFDDDGTFQWHLMTEEIVVILLVTSDCWWWWWQFSDGDLLMMVILHSIRSDYLFPIYIVMPTSTTVLLLCHYVVIVIDVVMTSPQIVVGDPGTLRCCCWWYCSGDSDLLWLFHTLLVILAFPLLFWWWHCYCDIVVYSPIVIVVLSPLLTYTFNSHCWPVIWSLLFPYADFVEGDCYWSHTEVFPNFWCRWCVVYTIITITVLLFPTWSVFVHSIYDLAERDVGTVTTFTIWAGDYDLFWLSHWLFYSRLLLLLLRFPHCLDDRYSRLICCSFTIYVPHVRSLYVVRYRPLLHYVRYLIFPYDIFNFTDSTRLTFPHLRSAYHVTTRTLTLYLPIYSLLHDFTRSHLTRSPRAPVTTPPPPPPDHTADLVGYGLLPTPGRFGLRSYTFVPAGWFLYTFLRSYLVVVDLLVTYHTRLPPAPRLAGRSGPHVYTLVYHHYHTACSSTPRRFTVVTTHTLRNSTHLHLCHLHTAPLPRLRFLGSRSPRWMDCGASSCVTTRVFLL